MSEARTVMQHTSHALWMRSSSVSKVEIEGWFKGVISCARECPRGFACCVCPGDASLTTVESDKQEDGESHYSGK